MVYRNTMGPHTRTYLWVLVRLSEGNDWGVWAMGPHTHIPAHTPTHLLQDEPDACTVLVDVQEKNWYKVHAATYIQVRGFGGEGTG